MAQEPACYFSILALLLPILANPFLWSLCVYKPIEDAKLRSCMWDTRQRHSYKSSTELRLPREVFWIFSCVFLLESSIPRPSHTLSCWAESNVTSIQPYSAEQTVASNIKQRKKGKHHRVYYKTPTCSSRCLLPILILRKVKCPTRVPEDFRTLSKPLLQ